MKSAAHKAHAIVAFHKHRLPIGTGIMRATGTGISFASGGALVGEYIAGFTGALVGALAIGIAGVVIGFLLLRHVSR